MGVLVRPFINLFMLLVGIVVQTYTYLTLPLYYLWQRPGQKLRLSRTLRSRQLDPTDPYSPYVRTGPTPDHPLTTCHTIIECMEKMKELYPMDRHSVGYRSVISENVVTDERGQPLRMDGKVVRKLKLTGYQWLTYGQVLDMSSAISKGLVINGFVKHSKCVILCDTCVENLVFTLSTVYIGVVCVGVFSNLGDEGIIHAITETEAEAIFTSYDLLDKVLTLSSRCPSLKTVIYVEQKIKAHSGLTLNNNDKPSIHQDIKMLPLSKLISDGINSTNDLKIDSFTKNDVTLIGYTSGTNGPPKGVYITFDQIREAALTLLPGCEKFMDEPERHIYVAYLPQVHVLEASIELIAFLGGARIGFANPLTLNESAPGLADGVVCDLKLLKPTVMAAVPLVLDRMRKEIYLKLSKRTPVSTDLFDYLIKYKIHWTQRGYNCPIVNKLLCSKVREQFGGRLEQMIVGGAPLCPRLQALIKAALNVRLIQGYGTTELSGAVLAMDQNDLSYGRCGSPLNGIHIRLADWSEGGYTALDEPNPRGELIVGGRGVSNGYYKNPELTGKSFICDEKGFRWFKTGDIGEVFPDGTFGIIDRKSDLIKLSNGEYFSLGKIEARLKNCQYVDNICVFGKDSHLIALVVPNRLSLQSLARNLYIGKGITFAEICNFSDVVESVHLSIVKTGLENGLHRRELPLRIYLCEEEWTPDNGLLTAALKLKRHAIMKRYSPIIDRMVEPNGQPVGPPIETN